MVLLRWMIGRDGVKKSILLVGYYLAKGGTFQV